MKIADFDIDLAAIVKKWEDKDGNLIMVLHEIQHICGYVPREISLELSNLLGVPLARIYEVLTFYNFFRVSKPAKHTIAVCMGTACYLKGAPDIINEIKNIMHVEEGEITKDGLFQFEKVRCLGCCGLAPVLTVDGKVYGKVKKSDVMGIISEYTKVSE